MSENSISPMNLLHGVISGVCGCTLHNGTVWHSMKHVLELADDWYITAFSRDERFSLV
jgi:hypothetical protein